LTKSLASKLVHFGLSDELTISTARLGFIPVLSYQFFQEGRAARAASARLAASLAETPVDGALKCGLSAQASPTQQDARAVTPDLIANLAELLRVDSHHLLVQSDLIRIN
jgi:hypothetical protein